MSLWGPARRQRVTSADTSLCQVAALVKRAPVKPGTVNLDLGGGRCNRGTEHLRAQGVTSHVFDPYNRSPAENAAAAQAVCCGKASTATVANVLNVVPDTANRRRVLQQAADAVGDKGEVFVSVYEGDGSGRGRRTSKGWQANRPLGSYTREVGEVFRDVTVRDGMIVARSPHRATCACPRR